LFIDFINLWGDTRRIRRYFHFLYEGDKRTYGDARRGSPNDNIKSNIGFHRPFYFLRQLLPALS